MASKPDHDPASGDWAKDGFTLVTPPDPSASQGDSDILNGAGREQSILKDSKLRTDFQRGDIKPLKSDWTG